MFNESNYSPLQYAVHIGSLETMSADVEISSLRLSLAPYAAL